MNAVLHKYVSNLEGVHLEKEDSRELNSFLNPAREAITQHCSRRVHPQLNGIMVWLIGGSKCGLRLVCVSGGSFAHITDGVVHETNFDTDVRRKVVDACVSAWNAIMDMHPNVAEVKFVLDKPEGSRDYSVVTAVDGDPVLVVY